MTEIKIPTASILIVDDEELNRTLLTRKLEEEGHRLFSCEKGEDALELIQLQKFDIILLDIMLPDINGITVLEKIRSNPELDDTHVIMVTASGDRETVLNCIDAGATDYIAKPFSMLIVKSRIQRCLKKSYSHLFYEDNVQQEPAREIEILLVDDQELNRDVLAHRLKKNGYKITCVANGFEALELLGNTRFDLVLLDVMMPDISGIEVLKKIRSTEKYNEMPVVMVTAKDDMNTINECMQAGANDYILKPLNTQLFKIRMASCLL